MMISTILGAFIAMGSSAVTQYYGSKRERLTEYRRRVAEACDGLSEAMRRFCVDCFELTGLVVDRDNCAELGHRYQLAILELEQAFDKPLVVRESLLPQDLNEIIVISGAIMDDIMRVTEGGEPGVIGDSFMDELLCKVGAVNMHLTHLMRKSIIGPGYNVDDI